MASEIIYIDNKFLEWGIYAQSTTSTPEDKIQRAYQIWSRAEVLISGSPTEFELSDAISNLKKCINQRLNLIEDTYKFRRLFPSNKTQPYLDLLSMLGVVRPFLIKNLFEIRNDIEHRDVAPPDRHRCTELLDITWYLLKSTDRMLFDIPSEWEVGENTLDANGCFVNVYFEHGVDNEISIRGWLPIEYVSERPSEGMLPINFKEMKSKNETLLSVLHKGRKESDKCVDGSILAESDSGRRLLIQLLRQ